MTHAYPGRLFAWPGEDLCMPAVPWLRRTNVVVLEKSVLRMECDKRDRERKEVVFIRTPVRVSPNTCE